MNSIKLSIHNIRRNGCAKIVHHIRDSMMKRYVSDQNDFQIEIGIMMVVNILWLKSDILYTKKKLYTSFIDLIQRFFLFQVLQWKRSENATYKDLRTRRPKIKAIVGLSKQSTTYDGVKWALDRLNIETVHCQTTESCINSCVVSSLTTTPGNNLSSLTHNNATTNTSNYNNKREALCPSLVLLDLKATKDLDPEAVSR